MSIRTELIEAKLAGGLHKTACDMLTSRIKSYADFCDFCDCIEKEARFGLDSQAIKNLIIGAGMLGTPAILGGSHLLTKKHHNAVLDTLMSDMQFPDKNKVKEIYNMVAKFAPKTMSNLDYAKAAMVQLYNSPMVTPEMVGKLVQIENNVVSAAPGIPGMPDIVKSIKGVRS